MKRIITLAMILGIAVSLLVTGCAPKTDSSDTPAPEETSVPEETSAAEETSVPEEEKVDYPTKPIELIIPFGAGGGTDLVGRIITNKIHEYLPNNQQMVVVNKPGGTATIGTTEVLEADPDGYKLELSIVSPLAIQPHFGETSYTVEDARAIIRVQDTPMVVAVSSKASWETIEEFVEYVKANPGNVTYAVTGNGSLQHLEFMEFCKAADIDMKAVSFTSGTDQVAALVGGHVDCAILQAHDAKAQLDAGGLKILLNLSNTKLSYLEDIPTAAEKGYKITLFAFTGFYGPKDLPDYVVTTIHDAVKKCLEQPDVIEQLAKIGVEPAYANSEDYGKEILESSVTAKEFLKGLGLIK